MVLWLDLSGENIPIEYWLMQFGILSRYVLCNFHLSWILDGRQYSNGYFENIFEYPASEENNLWDN